MISTRPDGAQHRQNSLLGVLGEADFSLLVPDLKMSFLRKATLRARHASVTRPSDGTVRTYLPPLRSVIFCTICRLSDRHQGGRRQ
jgi:hypothetical protein